jgi:hypothetical protein
MEEHMSYIITAEESEIFGVATSVHKNRRFLSDTPNVEDFKWYPLGDSGLQAIELTLIEGAVIPETDLALLTNHYTSMDIGVLDPENSVTAYISGGEVRSVD